MGQNSNTTNTPDNINSNATFSLNVNIVIIKYGGHYGVHQANKSSRKWKSDKEEYHQ